MGEDTAADEGTADAVVPVGKDVVPAGKDATAGEDTAADEYTGHAVVTVGEDATAGAAGNASHKNASHTFRSLEYGLGLLRLFTVAQPERGISELARELNVSSPTAHRYAATCLELGYLEQVATRRYRLARASAQPGAALFGALALSRYARPILRELRAQTGRTAALAILDGDEVLYLRRLCGWRRGQYRLERGLGAGSRRPAAGAAAGIALRAVAVQREHWHEPGLGEPARLYRHGPAGATGTGDGQSMGPAGATGTRHAPSRDGGRAAGAERPADTVAAANGKRAPRGARTLAIAVLAPPGEPDGAIELAVPARAMSEAEMLAQLGEPLRAAGVRLQAALNGERVDATEWAACGERIGVGEWAAGGGRVDAGEDGGADRRVDAGEDGGAGGHTGAGEGAASGAPDPLVELPG